LRKTVRMSDTQVSGAVRQMAAQRSGASKPYEWRGNLRCGSTRYRIRDAYGCSTPAPCLGKCVNLCLREESRPGEGSRYLSHGIALYIMYIRYIRYIE
jgi:hypothetical protein